MKWLAPLFILFLSINSLMCDDICDEIVVQRMLGSEGIRYTPAPSEKIFRITGKITAFEDSSIKISDPVFTTIRSRENRSSSPTRQLSKRKVERSEFLKALLTSGKFDLDETLSRNDPAAYFGTSDENEAPPVTLLDIDTSAFRLKKEIYHTFIFKIKEGTATIVHILGEREKGGCSECGIQGEVLPSSGSEL